MSRIVDLLPRYGYEPVRELGRGGMGVVYLARQVSLRRNVALKVLTSRGDDEDRLMDRFCREARMLRELHHPNVVKVLDVGLDDELPFICFEYLAGARPLDELIATGAVDPHRALELLAEIADGLAYLHENGIVHRDLKPANVLVDPVKGCKIIDLGLARSVTSEETRLTLDGHVLGTLSYIAPEQLLGDETHAAADVHAFALVAYEVLAGRFIFSARAGPRTISSSARLSADIPPLERWCPDLDPVLRDQLERCGRRDPQARPRMADLLPILAGRPPPGADPVLAGGTLADVPALEPSGPAVLPGRAEVTASRPPPGTGPAGSRVMARGPAGAAEASTAAAEAIGAPAGGSWPATIGRLAAGAAIASVAIVGALLLAFRPHATGEMLAGASPSTLVAPFPLEARLETRDGCLVLVIDQDPPGPAVVSWTTSGRAGSRALAAAARHEVVLDDAFTGVEGLAVQAPGRPLFLAGPLLEPLMLRLRERLDLLPWEALGRRPGTIPSKTLEELRLVVPVAPSWFGSARGSRSCLEILGHLHRLEALNTGFVRIGRPRLAPAAELLPESWRETVFDQGDPRDPVRITRQPAGWGSLTNARLDGKPIPDNWNGHGPGWTRLDWLLGVSGDGVKRDPVVEFAVIPEPATKPRVEFLLEFDLSREHLRDAELVMIGVDLCERDDAVVLFEINDRLTVRSSARPATTKPCLCPHLAVPPAAFEVGPNRIRLRLEPCPVREKLDPVYFNSLVLLILGPTHSRPGG